MNKRFVVGYGAALLSAALVGLFTVLNKRLLVKSVPALTAGAWTYFAAGLALLPWALRASGLRFKQPFVAIGWLLAGSVLGPSLYFIGLQLTSGVEGVMLINTEAVFTAFLAFVLFKEKLTSKTLCASLIILVGAIWVSWSGGSLLSGNSLGNLLIALGYLGWATKNNLGRLLGENIPSVTLVCLKALVAGAGYGYFIPCFWPILSRFMECCSRHLCQWFSFIRAFLSFILQRDVSHWRRADRFNFFYFYFMGCFRGYNSTRI